MIFWVHVFSLLHSLPRFSFLYYTHTQFKQLTEICTCVCNFPGADQGHKTRQCLWSKQPQHSMLLPMLGDHLCPGMPLQLQASFSTHPLSHLLCSGDPSFYLQTTRLLVEPSSSLLAFTIASWKPALPRKNAENPRPLQREVFKFHLIFI